MRDIYNKFFAKISLRHSAKAKGEGIYRDEAQNDDNDQVSKPVWSIVSFYNTIKWSTKQRAKCLQVCTKFIQRIVVGHGRKPYKKIME